MADLSNDKTLNPELTLLSDATRPVSYPKRTIRSSILTLIWFTMAVQLIAFMLSAQLYPALSVGTIIIATTLGNTIPAVVIGFTQTIGLKYGISFSTCIRSMFGIKGALIPSWIRALPAMFYFGLQTWLGGLAINELSIIMTGYSNYLLFTFIFGFAQIFTMFKGMVFIRIMNTIAAPVLLLMGIYLLYLLFSTSGLTFGEVWTMGGDGSMSFSIAVMALIGGWATLACSIQDIVKDCKIDEKDLNNWGKTNVRYFFAQWLGMVPACSLFGFIGVMSMALGGEWNPILAITNLVGQVSIPMVILFQSFIILATWSTNAAANLLNPAYVLCNTFPKIITFKKGVLISGIIGLLMFPWAIADSLTSVTNWFGGALGPVSGILIADFFIVKKQIVGISDLYNPNGAYRYWNGFNWGAIIALVLGIGIASITPQLMYITGLFTSLILHVVLSKYWVEKKHPAGNADIEGNDAFLS